MGQNFIGCDREQSFLMAPSVREWLPEGHLAWFVLAAVERLDLGEFYAAYRVDGQGRAAYDPGMMVGLLLYAYAVGVRSARVIERRCVEDVAFRVIAANRVPDHATIARFRAGHQGALGGLFSQVLVLCERAGLISAGVVAIDSTKVGANASGLVNAGYEQIAREILEQAAAIDAQEDERFGDRRGDELPPELADEKSRREWLSEALRELEQEAGERPVAASRPERLVEARRRLEDQRELECDAAVGLAAGRARREADLAARGRRPSGRPPTKPLLVPDTPRGKVNLTDPDSKPVKTHKGFIQGYNAQAAATAGQIVIAADVTLGTSDGGRLEPMLANARAELRAAGASGAPEVVLADSGYWNSEQITRIAQEGITVLVPPDAHTRASEPAAGRDKGLWAQMRSRLKTEEGRGLYRQRQQLIEPIFAQTKITRGAARFQRRGLAACRSEWRLITATHNLLKLWRTTPATA
jgi:transposase